MADVYNSTVDTPIYNELNCTSNADKMMCFLLNERTRELCGELQRWEDLARTKTLDARWHKFNDGVSRGLGEFKPEKHYYRPFAVAEKRNTKCYWYRVAGILQILNTNRLK